MRSRLAVLSVLASVVVLCVAVVAGPALATEGEGGTQGSTSQESGFGSGDWDGLLLAAIVGIAFGVGFFLDARPGEIGHDHH